MWDFKLSKSFGAMVATMPFIIFRLLVYVGVGLIYIAGIGIGGGLGYGFTSFSDSPGSGAGVGAFIGFAGAAGIAYWIREYVLYVVKAGHLALLVKHMDNQPIPGGQGQIEYAKQVVKARFAQSSLLFGLDQLIKGVLKIITGTINTVANVLPIPGLSSLAGLVNNVLKISLGYVDEVVLAHIIRTESDNPWETGRRSLVLYAQNFKTIAKNAVWLAVMMWVLTLLIFLVILSPVVALVASFPGSVGFLGFLSAFLLAWSLKAALLEPLCIYSLMNVYFSEIEGQEPDPEWDARLASASDKFLELRNKASDTLRSQSPIVETST